MEQFTQDQVDAVYEKLFSTITDIENKRYSEPFVPAQHMTKAFLNELMMRLYKDGKLPSSAQRYINEEFGYEILIPSNTTVEESINGQWNVRHINVYSVNSQSELQSAIDKVYPADKLMDLKGDGKPRCMFDKLIDANQTAYDSFDKFIVMKDCNSWSAPIALYSEKYKKAAFRTIGQSVNFSTPHLNDITMINSFHFTK